MIDSKTHHNFFVTFGILLLTVVFNTSVADTAKRFEAHMDFLASDLLSGRETGSLGHEVAAQYIATEFAKMGIVPAGDEGYMQRIKFKSGLLDLASTKFSIQSSDKEITFKLYDDYAMRADINRLQSEVSAELVFAGFGIDAPFLAYSDFDDINVAGKIAVVLAGQPNDFPSAEGAHYSRKSTAALVARGAIGVINVWTPVREKIFAFAKTKQYAGKPSIYWLDETGYVQRGYPELLGRASISMTAGKQLFALAGMDLAQIYKRIENGEKPKGQDMGISAKISYQTSHDSLTSPNVVGILEGSDPELKNEYVLLSAHTDHLGVSENIALGDKINNGAMDNAAGVATLLEMAHQFTQSDVKPKRSLLFVMVTGEEKGLLGSDYFANNPTVPLENIVANVNLDMPILTNDFDQLIGFGAQHSTLWNVISAAAEHHGMKLIPDPMPEQNIFVRSDQYSFVKKGIPAVYLVTADNAEMVFEDHELSSMQFRMHHYHKPSDQLDLPINYAVAAKFVAINRAITLTIANAEERPHWNAGSFFATIAEE